MVVCGSEPFNSICPVLVTGGTSPGVLYIEHELDASLKYTSTPIGYSVQSVQNSLVFYLDKI